MSIESHRRRRSSLFQRVAVPAPVIEPAPQRDAPAPTRTARPVTAPQGRVTLPFVVPPPAVQPQTR
ncbi:MAG: hypothetical protein K1X88_25820 [Nannocystaceae bacterium]|nr:hypothetical protein [Nannocystaceae bacterium]